MVESRLPGRFFPPVLTGKNLPPAQCFSSLDDEDAANRPPPPPVLASSGGTSRGDSSESRRKGRKMARLRAASRATVGSRVETRTQTMLSRCVEGPRRLGVKGRAVCYGLFCFSVNSPFGALLAHSFPLGMGFYRRRLDSSPTVLLDPRRLSWLRTWFPSSPPSIVF